jgi:nitrite reductase (NADH) small subunit
MSVGNEPRKPHEAAGGARHQAVVVLRAHADTEQALSDYDPIGRAPVLSRGIIGSRLVDGIDVASAASPLHEQADGLRSGRFLDDPETRIETCPTRVCTAGLVRVGGQGVA